MVVVVRDDLVKITLLMQDQDRKSQPPPKLELDGLEWKLEPATGADGRTW